MCERKDSVPALLLRGEYQFSAEAMKQYGPDLLEQLNRREHVMLQPLDATNPTMFTALAFGCTFLLGFGIGFLLRSVS